MLSWKYPQCSVLGEFLESVYLIFIYFETKNHIKKQDYIQTYPFLVTGDSNFQLTWMSS